jgi:hypothetical protein
MKRRRQKLQVSTFPFLAVLLSAMGSLILVLLAVDQKARAAARAKAQREAARVVEQAEQEAAERRAKWERKRQEARAEWERKRDDLHAQLSEEERALQARMNRLREQLADAAGRLRAEQDETGQLRRRLEVERGLLEGAEKSLDHTRAANEEAASQSEAARAWLARMTRDVEQLERALADLKAARERDRQTYSVIPYRGRHGEVRRPLYVECAGGKLTFHPDRLVLPESGPAADVRAEVERHSARQKEQLPAADQPSYQPYLMVLVRPDGVESYYHLQNALRGLDAEFGYEFIDADWLLDFPADDTPAKSQPWLAGTKPGDPAASTGSGSAGTPLKGVNMARGTGSGVGSPGGGGHREGEAPAEPPSRGGAGSAGASPSRQLDRGGPLVADGGSGGAAAGAQAGAGGSGSLPPGANPFTASGGAGTLPPGADPFTAPGVLVKGTREKPLNRIAEILPPSLENLEGGTANPSKGPGPAKGSGNAFPTTTGPGSAGVPPAASPPTPTDSPFPTTAGAATAGVGFPRPAASSSAAPPGGEAGHGEPRGGGIDPGPIAKAPPSNGSSSSPDASTPGGEERPRGVEPVPIVPNYGGSPQPPSTPGAGTPVSPQPPSDRPPSANQPPSGNQPSSGMPPGGAPSTGRGGDPAGRFAPGAPEEQERRPPPMRPVNLSGDRDWVIYVECTTEGVILYPARTLIPLAALSRGPANPLQQAVQQMIDRRQSSVRPGEAPYRPQVRFLVRPESMRVFHIAYPALGAVQAPMTRYNLRPEDDVLAIVTGH